MKFNYFLLLLITLITFSSIVSAFTRGNYSRDRTDYILFDDINTTILNGTVTVDFISTVNNSDVTSYNNGWGTPGGSGTFHNVYNLTTSHIKTWHIGLYSAAASSSWINKSFNGRDVAVCVDVFTNSSWGETDNGAFIYINETNFVWLTTIDCIGSGWSCVNTPSVVDCAAPNTGVNEWCFFWNSSISTTQIYLNRTKLPCNLTQPPSQIGLRNRNGWSDGGLKFSNIRVWNITFWGLLGPVEDLTAPTISNAICTSCISETNDTLDSTPTINVTVIDNVVGVSGVRIANDSSYNFSNATGTRDCTEGNGNTWVCTLPSSDKLTTFDVEKTLYFWANDTKGNYHSASNLSIGITLEAVFLKLNGLEKNRTYEYETTVNISTNFEFLDIIDNTNRFINVTSGLIEYNYTLNVLRTNNFNDTNTSRNINSGSVSYIRIANRTDVYNATINITGSNNPSNLSINYTNYLFFPGILKENNLFQNLFIFSGVYYSTFNLSYTTAGIKTIFINYSNQGNILNRIGYFNFTVTATSSDAGNEFLHQDNLSTDSTYNISSTINISVGSGIFDNFENNNSNWTQSGDTFNIVLDYINSTATHLNSLAISTDDVPKKRTITYAPDFVDLRNISYFEIHWDYFLLCNPQGAGQVTLTTALQIIDDSNSIDLKRYGWGFDFDIGVCGALGTSSESTTENVNLTGFKKYDGTWDIYINGSFDSNKDVSTLIDGVLKIAVEQRIHSGQFGEIRSRLSKIKMGGIWLERKSGKSGAYDNRGIYISDTFTSTNNIIRTLLSAEHYLSNNIEYKLSNDGGATWESINPNSFHTFESTGNELIVKIASNGTNESSPIVYNYRIEIISASILSLVVDIGADGKNDWTVSTPINETNTPINYGGNESAINDYINRSCKTGSYCIIPIDFIAGSAGKFEISALNLTENINPIRLNTTAIQTLRNIPIKPVYTGGTVNFNDIRFDFRGSKNITVYAHNSDYTESLNRTIFVKYSPLNISYWQSWNYWLIQPTEANQSDLEPFGQNSTHGIWKADSFAYDGNISIWARYNNTVNLSCVTEMNFRGQNFTLSTNNSVSTLNITNLTVSNQPIISNLNSTYFGNIKTFTMINCSEYGASALLVPFFCFNSLDSRAVLTQDFQDSCDVVE